MGSNASSFCFQKNCLRPCLSLSPAVECFSDVCRVYSRISRYSGYVLPNHVSSTKADGKGLPLDWETEKARGTVGPTSLSVADKVLYMRLGLLNLQGNMYCTQHCV